MNILVVSSKYPPEYSGSGLRAHNTYRRLHSRFGVNYKVLISSVTENESSMYEWDGVKVKRIANKIRSRSGVEKTSGFINGFVNRLYNRLISLFNYYLEATPVFIYLIRPKGSGLPESPFPDAILL